jgi:hypothetical protein
VCTEYTLFIGIQSTHPFQQGCVLCMPTRRDCRFGHGSVAPRHCLLRRQASAPRLPPDIHTNTYVYTRYIRHAHARARARIHTHTHTRIGRIYECARAGVHGHTEPCRHRDATVYRQDRHCPRAAGRACLPTPAGVRGLGISF